jgi:NAD(P)-dependent dehydrogenase (short-subunit alcohol dehydrogenase family)
MLGISPDATMGSVHCTKAVWAYMRDRNYGRIVMTASSSGLYGNFGQYNYGAAKMALVGLMNTPALEGARNNIRVNCIAPVAATQMLAALRPQSELDLLMPHRVNPGALVLVADGAPTKTILCAGAGSFESANVTLTQGAHLDGGPAAADQLVRQWGKIVDRTEEIVPESGERQARNELAKAAYARAASSGK